MKCLDCKNEYEDVNSGTCKWCYEDTCDDVEKLKSKLNFLRFEASESRLNFTDVVLVASNDDSGKPAAKCVPIPAHKAVLVNRSLVFKAQFEIEKEEIPNGTIKVSNVSYDVLRVFVNYLYTAEAHLDEKMACDLLVLAEKYKVMHLKTYCEEFLTEKLDSGNSLMSYSFARKHNVKKVLDASLPLILDNMEKVIKSEEYVELLEKDPRLLVEIYEAYLSKQDSSSDDDKE